MPAASGLFHRAILQSPGSPNAFEPAEGHALAAEFLRNLGTADTEALVKASAEDLWRAAAKELGVAAKDIPASTSRGVEKFFDGKVFDPANPKKYLESLEIKYLKTAA